MNLIFGFGEYSNDRRVPVVTFRSTGNIAIGTSNVRGDCGCLIKFLTAPFMFIVQDGGSVAKTFRGGEWHAAIVINDIEE